jgi:hypothetical protein
MPLSIRFTLRPLAILGIDPFRGAGIADLALFSLAPGSPSLGIMDPFLGRPLSGADVFVTDFDGTFAPSMPRRKAWGSPSRTTWTASTCRRLPNRVPCCWRCSRYSLSAAPDFTSRAPVARRPGGQGRARGP